MRIFVLHIFCGNAVDAAAIVLLRARPLGAQARSITDPWNTPLNEPLEFEHPPGFAHPLAYEQTVAP